MRHFERQEIAHRYATYRPQVQEEIIETVATELAWTTFGTALDVACGTGHSTRPLLRYATRVIGCDASKEMLAQAKTALPEVDFRAGSAESLPLPEASADLITVGFAFHWFDGPTFLGEAARILTPGGQLVLYNMVFPGTMQGNEAFRYWAKTLYLARFPSPERKRTPLSEILETAPEFTLEHSLNLSIPLTFSARGLRNYFTTQSNIAAALEAGDSLDEVDAWLDAELKPFFKDRNETFDYVGKANVLRKEGSSA